ncbi:MAG TPA: cytochrome c oxidase subunit II [Candidatus Dormibacteraeota bacterium]|nr:cytochrome c oxidase subunit II [Candidatus Dormibacteraeota bacterium]
MSTKRHLIIPAIIAAILAVIGDLLVVFVLHLPPGHATTAANDDTFTGQVFTIISWSVGIAVVTFAVYFLFLSARTPEETSFRRVYLRRHLGLQAAWLATSVVLVLFAAEVGVVALEGQVSPNLVVPASALAAGATHDPLIVQVIGQQWQFTYRYPQYGGFETNQLRLPTDRLIQFDVTSLDVSHSFSAYQLAVKIDAISGINNVGYVYILKPTVIDVRCGELCGLWHGYMTDVGSQAGEAVTQSQFASWVSYAQRVYGPQEQNLPKFALTYYPAPTTY